MWNTPKHLFQIIPRVNIYMAGVVKLSQIFVSSMRAMYKWWYYLKTLYTFICVGDLAFRAKLWSNDWLKSFGISFLLFSLNLKLLSFQHLLWRLIQVANQSVILSNYQLTRYLIFAKVLLKDNNYAYNGSNTPCISPISIFI